MEAGEDGGHIKGQFVNSSMEAGEDGGHIKCFSTPSGYEGFIELNSLIL